MTKAISLELAQKIEAARKEKGVKLPEAWEFSFKNND